MASAAQAREPTDEPAEAEACDEGEGGEEEAPEEDMEVTDAVILGAPNLADDGLGDVEHVKKKPRRSTNKKDAKDKDEGEDEDGVMETEGVLSEAPAWMNADAKLKKVVDRIGKIHRCFLVLNLDEAFDKRKPIGHQLRGARLL